MDPAQIDLVQRTFADVTGSTDQLALRFYDRLFALDPTVRPMFPDDLAAQRVKLVDELTAIVDSLGRLGALVQRTTELGARHAGYGVQPHHYDLVLDALIGALRDVLGEVMTDDAALAWRRAYHLVAETMLHGAAHPPATAS